MQLQSSKNSWVKLQLHPLEEMHAACSGLSSRWPQSTLDWWHSWSELSCEGLRRLQPPCAVGPHIVPASPATPCDHSAPFDQESHSAALLLHSFVLSLPGSSAWPSHRKSVSTATLTTHAVRQQHAVQITALSCFATMALPIVFNSVLADMVQTRQGEHSHSAVMGCEGHGH